MHAVALPLTAARVVGDPAGERCRIPLPRRLFPC